MDAARFWQQVSDPAQPPLLLPDVGTFFNNDVARGAALISQVSAAGIECVKGEILHDADICLATDTQETYLGPDAKPVQENYRALIERKTLPLADYERLFRPVLDAGLGLCLSVYDDGGTDFARDIGACALKIASTNIVHAPLIRHAAKSGLPLLLDSGKSGLDEVMRAVDWARDAGAERLVLEYSPPAPPAPVSDHNLRVLEKLTGLFDGPLGLSDHHAGAEMLYAATALGCRVLEKGVCPDDQAGDQDVFHALPVSQLEGVLQSCQAIHAALGDAECAYRPPAERPAARMGLVAARNLVPGDRLDASNVRFAFPSLGIAVEDWDKVSGMIVKQTIKTGTPIGWNHVVDTA